MCQDRGKVAKIIAPALKEAIEKLRALDEAFANASEHSCIPKIIVMSELGGEARHFASALEGVHEIVSDPDWAKEDDNQQGHPPPPDGMMFGWDTTIGLN